MNIKLRYKILALVLLLSTWTYVIKHFEHGIISPNVPHVLPVANDLVSEKAQR